MDNITIPEVFQFRGHIPSPDAQGPTGLRIYTHLLTGMDFVLISGGVCQIGSSGGSAHERPKHKVAVQPFLLSRFQVTLGQWRNAMGTEPIEASFSPDRGPVTRLGDAYPVADISWEQAKDFCRRTGLELPSETEWEYACRAGRNEDKVQDLDDKAWHYDNTNNRDVQPVGLKTPNAFGLYDMLGNVWEWCEDTWHDSYAGAPRDARPWIDGTSLNRVARGGGVEHDADSCTPYSRIPGDPDIDIGCGGFRVKSSLLESTDDISDSESALCVVPDGFASTGKRCSDFNGVSYILDWICHLSTGIELPLLPGGVYISETFPEISNWVETLFTEDVFITESGTTHPELLNSLLSREMEVYPLLVKYFLSGDRETRHFAAFWHTELSTKQLEWALPDAMPSALVFAAALHEEDESIRTMSAATFSGYPEHSRPYLPAICDLLDDPQSCHFVLSTLKSIGSQAKEALPALLCTALNHDDQTIISETVLTIEKVIPPTFSGNIPDDFKTNTVPLLLALIEHEYSDARKVAARYLGLLGGGSKVRAVLESKESDPDSEVRETVRQALRQIL